MQAPYSSELEGVRVLALLERERRSKVRLEHGLLLDRDQQRRVDRLLVSNAVVGNLVLDLGLAREELLLGLFAAGSGRALEVFVVELLVERDAADVNLLYRGRAMGQLRESQWKNIHIHSVLWMKKTD